MYIDEIDYYIPPPPPLYPTLYKLILKASITPHPAGTLPVMPVVRAEKSAQGMLDKQLPVHQTSAVDNSCEDQSIPVAQGKLLTNGIKDRLH